MGKKNNLKEVIRFCDLISEEVVRRFGIDTTLKDLLLHLSQHGLIKPIVIRNYLIVADFYKQLKRNDGHMTHTFMDISIDYFSSLNKTPNIVMTPNSGDSIYIGCESMESNEPALNHTTVRATATNAGAAGTQTQLEIDGGVDIRNVFAPEDVLVAHDDVVIGTVETVSSATVFNLKGTNTGIITDDDYIYMQSPITLILGFEYV